jgi:hypothetical protein
MDDPPLGKSVLERAKDAVAPMRAQAVTWKRWGQWSAHLHDDEGQLCSTQHFNPTRKAPDVCELSPSGLPYGRICNHCLKTFRRFVDKH